MHALSVQVCDDSQRQLLMTRITIFLNQLKKLTYGKHIVARVEKLLVAGNAAAAVQQVIQPLPLPCPDFAAAAVQQFTLPLPLPLPCPDVCCCCCPAGHTAPALPLLVNAAAL